MAPDGERILVVDDEMTICRNCVRILSKSDYHVDYALSGYEALQKLEAAAYDVIITDLKMSAMGGMELLERVRESHPDIPVIVMTGYASVASAVEVMKVGAMDYLPKPFTPDEIRGIVSQAISERQLRLQRKQLEEHRRERPAVTHQLIGNSPKIKKVISMIQKVAPTDSTVLVTGESGTGKELVARAVHANSSRNQEVFFAVDCGTLSGSLLESELFGHRRGAFTGAHRDKDGIFKSADGGTVFLDEISNISLEVQGKLLRFLETREFLPLGADTPLKVDIRLILATNEDLKEMVAAGKFRHDFYYRIFVYPIMLPPLRDRKMDILPIAYHFLDQINRQMGRSVNGFDDDAAAALTGFDWPGNVRQLRNTVERAIIQCEGDRITPAELPRLGVVTQRDIAPLKVPETNTELKAVKKQIRQQAVSEIEKRFILTALENHGWNVSRAAEKVGLQRSNFHKLMKKHGISIRSTS
jgi:DNA-binding NtrC family response regulator